MSEGIKIALMLFCMISAIMLGFETIVNIKEKDKDELFSTIGSSMVSSIGIICCIILILVLTGVIL